MQSRISSYSLFRSTPVPEFKNIQNIMFPMINVLDNVVLKKIKNDDEYKYQTFFSEKVLQGISPHFPLVYNKDDNNNVMMMEKFDGDFCSVEREFQTIDEYMSFFLQIIMALYTIDSCGKFHGDLNPGNTLFKKINDEDEEYKEYKGYLKYVIDGETYYIKHYNRLWVVSDFEYTGDKGEVLETSGKGFEPSFFKKLFREHYESIDSIDTIDSINGIKKIKGSWLYDLYTITRFTEFHKIADRVFHLMMQDKDKEMNPIEAIPLLIKNDIRHIFIRGELSI